MDQAILNRLTANLSEVAVYAAIVLVTLIGLCKCIYPLLRNAALLNRAVIKLEKSTAAGERPMWRENRFLGRSLRNEWQQFLLNLKKKFPTKKLLNSGKAMKVLHRN